MKLSNNAKLHTNHGINEMAVILFCYVRKYHTGKESNFIYQ